MKTGVHVCEIEWVDNNGFPTPDNNVAVGDAVCVHFGKDGNEKGEPSRFPICAEHLERMPQSASINSIGEVVSKWHFEPYKQK